MYIFSAPDVAVASLGWIEESEGNSQLDFPMLPSVFALVFYAYPPLIRPALSICVKAVRDAESRSSCCYVCVHIYIYPAWKFITISTGIIALIYLYSIIYVDVHRLRIRGRSSSVIVSCDSLGPSYTLASIHSPGWPWDERRALMI